MTTLVVEVPDNKSDFVYNLLNEFPFTNIYKQEINQTDKFKLSELLKEGYLATAEEDTIISNEFENADFENWD